MPSERIGNDDVTHNRREAADVVTKLSPWSMVETVARLSAVVTARGMNVFAIIDHGSNARELGLELRDTVLVIFGNRSTVTRVIDAAPLAALDVPLRVVVWQDGYQTMVSYASATAIARRYDLNGDLVDGLASIDAVVSSVIDR